MSPSRGWLDGLDPPVPAEFVSWLGLPGEDVDAGGGEPPSPEALLEGAMTALRRALSSEGRERGGAFDLLAADAFATWAAEAALGLEEPEGWLEEMAVRLARGPG